MPQFELFALVAGFGLVMTLIMLTLRGGGQRPRRGAWMVPALLSAAFFVYSAYTIATEGPTGFWPVHTQSAWGNQVWFDLLLAAGTAFSLLLPRMRAAGMNVWLWMVTIPATGSVGLLAALARLFYLEERQP